MQEAAKNSIYFSWEKKDNSKIEVVYKKIAALAISNAATDPPLESCLRGLSRIRIKGVVASGVFCLLIHLFTHLCIEFVYSFQPTGCNTFIATVLLCLKLFIFTAFSLIVFYYFSSDTRKYVLIFLCKPVLLMYTTAIMKHTQHTYYEI